METVVSLCILLEVNYMLIVASERSTEAFLFYSLLNANVSSFYACSKKCITKTESTLELRYLKLKFAIMRYKTVHISI